MLRDHIQSAKQTSRDDWLFEFLSAVVMLRPEYSSKRARAAAIVEYVTHSQDDPREAARAWAGRNKVG